MRLKSPKILEFEQIVEDIRNLKIQGAQAVAVQTIKTFSLMIDVIYEFLIKNEKAKNLSENEKLAFYLKELNSRKHILYGLRPTEPCARNALDYTFKNIKLKHTKSTKKNKLKSKSKSKSESKSRNIQIDHLESLGSLKTLETLESFHTQLKQNILFINNHFKDVKKRIVQYGANKIKNGMVVFTHCHSSNVTSILIEAKKQGKKFEVHNTETRPLFQGRITAKELSDHGIKVTHFVDSGARYALKNCDIMLIGADAITSEGKVINKIGSEMFAEVANKFEIPIYSCTDSWKFDPQTIWGVEEKIEERNIAEIWPKGEVPKNVTIHNYAFEIVSPNLISGIISELGIYKPQIFIEQLSHEYPWMF